MEFIPQVNVKSEFLEIANDFGNSLEIFREAISNSIDAHASTIDVNVYIDKTSGENELVITISDNGTGMSEDDLCSFFGLGYSTRLHFDDRGNKIGGSIGEKGHGTKIYLNSRRIEIVTIKDNNKIQAIMDNPIRTLRSQNDEMPTVKYKSDSSDDCSGTFLKIFGYNSNSQESFSHAEIRDYILWFTKFGSCELELGISEHKNKKIKLCGLGRDDSEDILFGHEFPDENSNITELKKLDRISPLDYYVSKWVIKDIPVHGFPSITIDMVFYLEGDKVKREKNKMIHKPHTSWAGGVYNVEERYGLWLCKDYIPIERHNKWVSEKSEWTKFHAFVNCQSIKLTANRGDAGNTSHSLLEKIGETVKDIFKTQIENTDHYQKYQEELEKTQQYRNAEKEEQDFKRRRRIALQKKAARFLGFLILEPRQEGGVFSIVTQLLTLDPNLFNFKVIDYDTKIGYDLLVTKSSALDLNNAAMFFVEMKYKLKNDFNHSFRKLASIICWDTNIPDDYEVVDLGGEKRKMKITPKSAQNNYTKFMLVSDTEDHNIEVFVLRKYLKEKYEEIEFVPRGELQ